VKEKIRIIALGLAIIIIFILASNIYDDKILNHINIQNVDHNTNDLQLMVYNMNYTLLRPVGISMEPTIFHNDTLICDDTIIAKVGDIVAVNGVHNFTHRIIADYETYLLTSGDNPTLNKVDKINRSEIECVIIGVLY